MDISRNKTETRNVESQRAPSHTLARYRNQYRRGTLLLGRTGSNYPLPPEGHPDDFLSSVSSFASSSGPGPHYPGHPLCSISRLFCNLYRVSSIDFIKDKFISLSEIQDIF